MLADDFEPLRIRGLHSRLKNREFLSFLTCAAVAILRVTLMAVLLIVAYGLAVGFVFGRVFLVVEAFISLRSLPAGAYDTVSWQKVFWNFREYGIHEILVQLQRNRNSLKSA